MKASHFGLDAQHNQQLQDNLSFHFGFYVLFS
jgi:hypothetical protein